MSDTMVKIARDRVGAAPGGYTWDKPHAVVEVPYDLAVDLLSIRGAGFYESTDDLGGVEEEDDLESLTKNQLIERAKELGLDTANKTKAQIIEDIVQSVSV